MRIRRRQAPCTLPPALPPDLPQNPPPPVQHHSHRMGSPPHENLPPQSPQSPHFQPLPPDQANQLLPDVGTPGWDWTEEEEEEKECVEFEKDEEVEDERLRDGEKSNDISFRMASIFGAETGSGVLPSSEVGRWGEGEKAFPLKKRRGSFERGAGGCGGGREVAMNQETIMEKEKKMKTKMKTKMNKKCARENEDEEQGSEKETKKGFDTSAVVTTTTTSSKKRSRGGALMEGSRCSRVNGRGWRCCQQTLVGYSLCEHHLGKGRLRSMSSVRSRAGAASKKPQQELSNSSPQIPEKNQEEGHHSSEDIDKYDNEKKPLMSAKKRVKIGMVKARSLSSLLGQPSNAVAVAAAVDDNK